ncbi:MAG: hypothetical protein LRS43_00255, partial [Desulfurococcales archaeon]|nr:hypothetical protein [Desulfurococcales archaeon]
MLSTRPSISLFYPGPRSVAYSSLAFLFFKGYLGLARAPFKAFFAEDGRLEAEGRGGLSPSRSTAILASLPYELLYAEFARM